MELINDLEQYLLDSRQIDSLARLQARLIRSSAGGGERETETGVIVLLVLAALHRGAPRSSRNDLLVPLMPETVSTYAAAARSGGTSDAQWESALVSNNKFFEDTADRLFADPAMLGPLCGTGPSGSPEMWPVLVVSDGFLGFSQCMHAAGVLEKVYIPRRIDITETSVSPDIVRAALHRVFVEQTALEAGKLPHCRQVAATALACRTRFLVISGGPGTGKTTVVLQLLRTLLEVFPDITADRIALCAPTGRAKARLLESLGNGLDMLRSGVPGTSARPVTAKTLQGLLVQQPDGTFRFNRDNPLAYRVVVVDEASMMDINHFAALMEALPDDCRLVLVGDMHQLPSVEAGAPLGDLTECFAELENAPTISAAAGQWLKEAMAAIPMAGCDELDRMLLDTVPGAQIKAGRLADHVVILTKSFRGNDAILDLAASVNNCETDRAVALLAGNSSNKALELDINDGTARIETWLGGNFGSSPGREAFALFATGGKPDPEMSETLAAANAVLFRSTILTLSHEGARGRLAINAIGEKMLRKAFGISAAGRFFPGLPVILGSNHHDLDLYNGDLGVVVATALGVKVLFPRGKTFRLAAPDRLRDLESAFALTVHKSQGSEFGNVLLVLPEKESPLLSRQIVYTGITRAKNRVVVLGQEAIFRKAVERREQREGGVRIL